MTEYVASDRLINSTPIEQPQSLVVAAPMVTQTVKAVSETIVTTFVAIGDAGDRPADRYRGTPGQSLDRH